jgi:hypothetical protein
LEPIADEDEEEEEEEGEEEEADWILAIRALPPTVLAAAAACLQMTLSCSTSAFHAAAT